MVDNEQLISLVKARPALWDKQIDDFKDKRLKVQCWREVCLIFNEDFDTLDEKQRQEYGKLIQRKWAGLRDCWVKKLKEQNQPKSTDSGAKKSRPYIYDQQLSFLRKIYSDSPYVVDVIVDVDVDSIDEQEQHNFDSRVQFNKRKIPVRSELDNRIIKFIEHQMNAASKTNTEEENRHLAFFKGLLPSVNKFDDDQTLEFQAGVISLVQTIKHQKTRGS